MAIAEAPRIRASDLAREQRAVEARLAHVRRRVRSHLVWEGIAWTFGSIFLLGAISLALDWLLRLNLSTRMALLAIGALAIATVAWRWLISPALVQLADLDLAELIDRRRPGTGQQIANVLQLPRLIDGDLHASPSMIAAAVREQAASLERTDLNSIFADARRRGLMLMLAGWVLLAAAFFVFWPATANLWTRRWLMGENVRWPQSTYLSVVGLEGDDARLLVPRGEAVLLQVDAQVPFTRDDRGWRMNGRGEPLVVESQQQPTSEIPGQVSIGYSTTAESHQGNFTHFEGGRFRYELPPVGEQTEMNITGGDDWLGPITIEPIDRPSIASLTIDATAYGSSRTESRTVGEGDTQLLFLPKTKIRLRMTAKEPLVSAELLGFGEQPFRWERQDELHYEAQWEMDEAVTLEVRLVGQHGSLANKPYFLTIGRLTDREPRWSTIRSSGVGRRITPQARIPLSLRVLDDFGLVQLGTELEQSVIEEGKTKSSSRRLEMEEFKVDDGGAPVLEADRQLSIALRDMGLSAGTAIKLRGVAIDNCALGAHTGYSRWLGFQIVTPEELFYEILMRQRDQRARFTAALATAKTQLETLETAPSGEQAAGLLRTHQVIARQVWQIANQLDGTLQEMTLNDLGNSQARELLETAIIAPLRSLHAEQLAQLRPLLEGLSPGPASEERRAAAHAAQTEAVQIMQQILAAMSQWESFVDVVNQLRQVIKSQGQVLDSTEQLKKERTKDLFDN